MLVAPFCAGDAPPSHTTVATWASVAYLVVLVMWKACDGQFANTSDKENAIGKTLLHQAQQWYTLALQDEHAQSKYQHVSFAAAYIHAARHVLNDSMLGRLTGYDVHELQRAIDALQKTANVTLHKQCPKLKQYTGKRGAM